jgi:FkbM family methyltransferase
MRNYYSLLANHSHPVRFVLARILMASGLSKFFTIPLGAYRIRFHPSNVAMYRWIAPRETSIEIQFLKAYLKLGDNVVDVGANIGETVLAESTSIGSSGRVIAFEPHPKIYSFLQENLQLNSTSNVDAHNLALGAENGLVRFSNSRRDDMNRVSEADGTIHVPVRRLDDCTQLNSVRLLKVDVEGYEKFVFAGASRILQHTECVFFEISTSHFAGFSYTTRAILELLLSAGFCLHRIVTVGELAPVTLDYESRTFENLVALRDTADFQKRTGWRIAQV